MSDLLAQLASVVPKCEQLRVSGWQDGPSRPPDAVLNALLVMARASSPWLPFFLRLASVYLPFEKTPTRIQTFLRACSAVHRCCQGVGSPGELTLQIEKRPRCLITAAFAVDSACAAEGPTSPLAPALRLLLPGRYVVTLGWDNLTPHVAPQIMGRLKALGREGTIKREHWQIARRLYSARGTPDINALALAAVGMLSSRRRGRERYSPGFIHDSLDGAGMFLRFIRAKGVSGNLGDVDLARKIRIYLETQERGVTVSSKRDYVKRYLDCADTHEEYIAVHPGFLGWALPLLKRVPEVKALLREAKAAQQARRGEEVKALAVHYLSLIEGVKARAEVFAQIHEHYRVAVEQFLQQGHGRPVLFEVRLKDGSAVFRFAVLSGEEVCD